MRVVFKSGDKTATVKTARKDRFALIGNFKGMGYRVISIHKASRLANPSDVHNSDFSDVLIAERED